MAKLRKMVTYTTYRWEETEELTTEQIKKWKSEDEDLQEEVLDEVEYEEHPPQFSPSVFYPESTETKLKDDTYVGGQGFRPSTTTVMNSSGTNGGFKDSVPDGDTDEWEETQDVIGVTSAYGNHSEVADFAPIPYE